MAWRHLSQSQLRVPTQYSYLLRTQSQCMRTRTPTRTAATDLLSWCPLTVTMCLSNVRMRRIAESANLGQHVTAEDTPETKWGVTESRDHTANTRAYALAWDLERHPGSFQASRLAFPRLDLLLSKSCHYQQSFTCWVPPATLADTALVLSVSGV